MTKSSLSAVFFLFTFLIGIYALFYNGVPVTDDEQLFASAAMNLATQGDFSAGQLLGNTRLNGNYYGVEPLHPVFAAVWYTLISKTAYIGGLQELYLLPILYTSLTAVLILAIARLWGYSLRVGIIVGIIFGLGTIAFPYARMFFRETLAMCLMTLAWLCFEFAAQPGRPSRIRLLAMAAWLLIMIGVLLTKITLIVSLPAFITLAWVRRKNLTKGIKHWKWGFWIISLTIGAGILYGLVMDDLPGGFFNRLSVDFFKLVYDRIKSIPHDGFIEAFLGALISPGKGLFIYSPILVLSISSLFLRTPNIHIKQNGENAQSDKLHYFLLPLSTLLGLVIVQACIYDREWWNVTWGTRFLLPVLPLLIISGLPALDHVLGSNRRLGWWCLVILSGLSLLIQLGGVLVIDPTYLSMLYEKFPDLEPNPILWNPYYAPLIGHWRLLFSSNSLPLAWMWTFKFAPASVIITLALDILLIVISGWKLINICKQLSYSTDNIFEYRTRRYIPFYISASILILLPFLLLISYRNDGRYYANRADFRTAYAWVKEDSRPGDVVVLRSYLLPSWYYLMNFYRLPALWYALPLPDDLSDENGFDPIDDRRIAFFERLSETHKRVWVIVENLPSDGSLPDSAEEIFLKKRFVVSERRIFSSNGKAGAIRVGLFVFK